MASHAIDHRLCPILTHNRAETVNRLRRCNTTSAILIRSPIVYGRKRTTNNPRGRANRFSRNVKAIRIGAGWVWVTRLRWYEITSCPDKIMPLVTFLRSYLSSIYRQAGTSHPHHGVAPQARPIPFHSADRLQYGEVQADGEVQLCPRVSSMNTGPTELILGSPKLCKYGPRNISWCKM